VSGRWTNAPAPWCQSCWREGRDVKGQPFKWGYPLLNPSTANTLWYCDECQEKLRHMNVELKPVTTLADV
jgi:hypothetical protein